MSARFAIRPARGGDEPGIAAVHWAARRVAYRGLLPQENLDQRTVEALTEEWIGILKRREGEETLVAEEGGGRILGFATGGPVRERKRPIIGDLSGVTAEVSLLYVLPERMGEGIGRALLARSVERLHRLGHRALVVWGYRGNPFLEFYERLGGRASAESDWEVAGRLFPTRAYVWRDLPELVEACN
jgi:GNAT superfamily N-acetyltransferase